MVRQDIIDLKKTIDTWCNCIRSATELWDAMVCRSCALQAVDDAGEKVEIDMQLSRFLKKKVFCALVESGFRSSRYSQIFGFKYSRRYNCLNC